ncbi:MAG: AAA family ATPase [Acidimicrobiia bacterium]
MLTSFVGRDREIGELEALLYTHRLVTVTGPGGVGKTRLAVQVASEVTDRFADGVWLVELAAVTTSDVLALGVRSAMGLPEQPGRSSEETLEEFARTKTMLVVLDNCEHLLDSVVPLVERMLRAGTESRVLATSRELLGLSGERVLSVSPLALPLELSEPAWVRENPAVALFLDRAGQAGFRPTDQQLIKVAAVCRRLDGLPLALELAAARLRGLSLEDVAVRPREPFPTADLREPIYPATPADPRECHSLELRPARESGTDSLRPAGRVRRQLRSRSGRGDGRVPAPGRVRRGGPARPTRRPFHGYPG